NSRLCRRDLPRVVPEKTRVPESGVAAPRSSVAGYLLQPLLSGHRARRGRGAGGGGVQGVDPAPAAVLRPAAVRLGNARSGGRSSPQDPPRALRGARRRRSPGGSRALLRVGLSP